MKKAYTLSKKILEDIEMYTKDYTSAEGKQIRTEESLYLLDKIIKNGLTLYKRVCDKKLYVGRIELEKTILEINKLLESLQMTKANAENLNSESALQLWEQLKILIACLACGIMDYQEGLN